MIEFPETTWSLVRSAGASGSNEARLALARLCEMYWYPVYVYIRCKGHDADEAADLAQGFFTRVVEKSVLSGIEARGRFRGFLLVAVKHYLSNERERAAAQKRGGDRLILSIDVEEASRRYAVEPRDDWTPERQFDRQWALDTMERALATLGRQLGAEGRSRQFDILRPFLTADEERLPQRELAADLGIAEGTVKVVVHRMRKRFCETLRQTIAPTVADAEDVEAEVAELFRAIGGDP